MEDKVIQQSFTFKNSDRMTAQAKKTATNSEKKVAGKRNGGRL